MLYLRTLALVYCSSSLGAWVRSTSTSIGHGLSGAAAPVAGTPAEDEEGEPSALAQATAHTPRKDTIPIKSMVLYLFVVICYNHKLRVQVY